MTEPPLVDARVCEQQPGFVQIHAYSGRRTGIDGGDSGVVGRHANCERCRVMPARLANGRTIPGRRRGGFTGYWAAAKRVSSDKRTGRVGDVRTSSWAVLPLGTSVCPSSIRAAPTRSSTPGFSPDRCGD